MMKKFSKQLLIFAAVATFSVPIHAQGFYLAASAGQTQSDTVCDGLDDVGFSGSCDDDDTGWKLSLGYQLTPNWGIEAFYADLGEYDARGIIAALPAAADGELDGYGIAVIGTLPLSDKFSLLGKIGVISWDFDSSSKIGSAGGGGGGGGGGDGGGGFDAGLGPSWASSSSEGASSSDDGTDIMFGLGASYSLTDNLSIRAEWEYYDDIEVDLFSAGIVYKFF